MRVLSRTNSGVDKLADLKGKIVGVGDLGGPDKNFFSIQLAKQGIDPNKDVDWRVYPGNLLQLAVEKGEVQAFLASDPIAYLWLKDSALQGSRLQSRRRIQGQDLLHRRSARQPRARGAAGGARPHPGPAGCGDVHLAESGQGRGLVPALCAEDRQPAGSAGDGPLPHPSSPSRRRRAQAGAEGLCGRSEDSSRSSSRAPTRRNLRSGSMSTYSASKAVALPQSAEEGAAFAGRPLSLPASFLANGTAVFASIAWVGFGLSCLWWADLGDWSRTHELAVAAFVIAGGILAVTLGGSWLGRFGAGAAAARAVAAGARVVPDPVGSRDRQIRVAAAAVLSAAAGDHRGLYR